jgi:hypothetical protein
MGEIKKPFTLRHAFLVKTAGGGAGISVDLIFQKGNYLLINMLDPLLDSSHDPPYSKKKCTTVS